MMFLQTKNIKYLGFFSIYLRTLTKTGSYLNSSIIFDMSFHIYVIQILHLIFLSVIWWLVKLVMFLLEYNPNKLLAFQCFVNISFIWLYTLPGMYLTFIDIIVCNTPWSYKHFLLSFKKGLFFDIISCSYSKFVIRVHWYNCFDSITAQPIIRVFTWNLFFIILYHGFQILLPKWNTCLNLVTYCFISSYLFFEGYKISYSLLNMFHIFGY